MGSCMSPCPILFFFLHLSHSTSLFSIYIILPNFYSLKMLDHEFWGNHLLIRRIRYQPYYIPSSDQCCVTHFHMEPIHGFGWVSPTRLRLRTLPPAATPCVMAGGIQDSEATLSRRCAVWMRVVLVGQMNSSNGVRRYLLSSWSDHWNYLELRP